MNIVRSALAILFVATITMDCATSPLPSLHVEGTRLVDSSGKRVLLKGANLGNWLVIEFWMFGLRDLSNMPGDQYELEQTLASRFGEAQKERLMNIYRDAWINERDFDNLRSFGFNFVRLPMNYRLMEDDRKPFELKPDAWKWIDRAVDLAESHGMYVLLDMHGAQGGQNPYDHSGRGGQNHLKDNATDQKRLAWLWGEIAKRYRKRSAVFAYDPFNEPYGMPKETQVSVFKRVLTEIRTYDPDKLVYAPGHYDGFGHYGDPKAQGWHNVGFQLHYYPGLFGNGQPNIRSQQKHIEGLKSVADNLNRMNVPFIVGEFNVVYEAAGGADMMRRYYDLYGSYGWSSSMWAYKAYCPEGGVQSATWGAVVNQNPSRSINFATATLAEIEKWMKEFGSEPLTINQKLRAALIDPAHKPAELDPGPPKRVMAPHEAVMGWAQTDIGSPMKGGAHVINRDEFDLFGGGSDIWGSADQFRFLHQTAEGDVTIETTVHAVEDIETYTKAGVMIRASLDANSPFALVSVFPSGEVQFATRDHAGAEATSAPNFKASLPDIRVRLVRKGTACEGFVGLSDGSWKSLGSVVIELPKDARVGAVALSHEDSQLAKITYRRLKVTRP